RQPLGVQPDGCPVMGDDCMVDRLAPRPQHSIRPGLHRPRREAPDVVWWDPSLLRLDVEVSIGLRQQALLREDLDRESATGGIERQAAWQAERAAARAAAAEPSLRLVTPTDLAHADEALPVELQPEA